MEETMMYGKTENLGENVRQMEEKTETMEVKGNEGMTEKERVDGVMRQEILSWSEMNEMLGHDADRTLSGLWRILLYYSADVRLYAFVGSTVVLDEYGRPISPFEPFKFTQAREMLEGMNLPFDLEKKFLEKKFRELRWCALLESHEENVVKVRICEPRDATHVLLPHYNDDSLYRLADDIILRDDVKVFSRKNSMGWILVPLGFQTVILDMDADAKYLTDDGDYVNLDSDTIKAYAKTMMVKRAKYWRNLAQKEYEKNLQEIVTRRRCIAEGEAAKKQLEPVIKQLQKRIEKIDWSWACYVGEIGLKSLDSDDTTPTKTIKLPAGWRYGLGEYVDDMHFKWLGVEYLYSEQNVAYVEACIAAIEEREEAIKEMLKFYEQVLDLALEFQIGFSVEDAYGQRINHLNPCITRKGKRLRLVMGQGKAMFNVGSSTKEVYEYRLNDLAGMRGLLSRECAKYPITLLDRVRFWF